MKFKYLLTLLPLFFICSCNDDGDSGCTDCNNTNVVVITDDVVVNTTWYADSIYVIKAWDFYVTATLTIQPGTIIKFTADGPFMGTSGSGTIVAMELPPVRLSLLPTKMMHTVVTKMAMAMLLHQLQETGRKYLCKPMAAPSAIVSFCMAAMDPI
jgi:hypothetical protein